jgi:hypothetical protein
VAIVTVVACISKCQATSSTVDSQIKSIQPSMAAKVAHALADTAAPAGRGTAFLAAAAAVRASMGQGQLPQRQ